MRSATDAATLEIVTSEARLAEVTAAWSELWQRADGLVFQHPGWIAAWWSTDPHCTRRALRIGLAWRGDRLEAVLPLASVRRSGVRMLEWAAKDHSDYGDALLAPDCGHGALAGLWRHVIAGGGFDIAYLNRLLPDARAWALSAPDAPGVKLRPNHRGEVSYRVAGPWRNGKEWFEQQSKKTRQNYRRGCKFMEEGGQTRFRLMEPDEPLGPVLARVAALKREWLARHERASDLFDEGAPALAALVAVLAELGVLRIFVLERAGLFVAISINFVQRGTMMAFVTTYDPDFERGSPGMVLMMDYIQWSIDQGLTMVDFLCGGEDFKRRFATQSVALSSVLGARTLRGSVAALADRANHAVKTWRARRPPAAAASGGD